MNNNPIHEENGQWYFWDETWAHREGPFATEEIARKQLGKYCREVLDMEAEEIRALGLIADDTSALGEGS